MRGADLVGQTICDSYIVEKVIGSGTMGVVFEVRHVRLPRRFAMKVLHAELAGGAETFARFRREAEVTSALGHPHIVDVVDWNRLEDNTPFLVMEFLEGEDLHTRLLERGSLPLPAVLELMRQVGSALTAAHKHGVVHRDLKPQNIFLCREDRGDEQVEIAKVVDFGISKLVGDPGQYTGAMRVMGTPLYMAPEQAMGFAANVDGRADQFALAAIAYHALSGSRPFNGESVAEIVLKVMSEEPVPLGQLVPGLPRHVELAIKRALSKDRENRFPSIGDFVRALGVKQEHSARYVLGPTSGDESTTPAGGVKSPGSPRLEGQEGAGTLEQAALLTAGRTPLLPLLLVLALCTLSSWTLTRLLGRALIPAQRVKAQVENPAPAPRPVAQAPWSETVRLHFIVSPPTAEIFVDGRKIDRQIEVQRGGAELSYQIKARGYTTVTDTFVPRTDTRIVVQLAPLRSVRPPGRPAPQPSF